MVPQIRISTNSAHFHHVAEILSYHLHNLGCRHAYIGGFACTALGGQRSTQDLDLLISKDSPLDAQTLRTRLTNLDGHFVIYGTTLYYVQDVPEQGRDVRQHLTESLCNVKIETLPGGAIGLPNTPQPCYMIQGPNGYQIPILHPSILIITKLKRWIQNCSPTRPKSIQQHSNDEQDLFLLIDWMSQRGVKIDCEAYQGKGKEEIRGYLREVRNLCSQGMGNQTLLDKLMLVTNAEDWL